MNEQMDANGIPASVKSWVTRVCKAEITDSQRIPGGLSRKAFSLRLNRGSSPGVFLMLQGSSSGDGNRHDAHVLALLEHTEVRTPRVIGYNDTLKALLIETLEGETDITRLGSDAELQLVSADLMLNLASLHKVDVARLSSAALPLPISGEDCVRQALEPLLKLHRELGGRHDPLIEFSLRWLEANKPDHLDAFALVHGDIGPGNFLFKEGRVTGIVDWEMAHIGDPMEDIARICIRCMSTPMGDIAALLQVYEQHIGQAVDRQRVAYYSLLTLVKSVLLIRSSLASSQGSADTPQKFMYEALLMRAASDVLLAASGLSPLPALLKQAEEPDQRDFSLNMLVREVESSIQPLITDSWLRGRLDWVIRMARHVHHSSGLRDILLATELQDAGQLSGKRFNTLEEADSHIYRLFDEAGGQQVDAILGYLARRVRRECYLRRELLGPLYENRITRLDS
jgi:aminoglycoside phosphotransferase (APT) family kinase protein